MGGFGGVEQKKRQEVTAGGPVRVHGESMNAD